MRILLTGAKGQLGSELSTGNYLDEHIVLSTDTLELDITSTEQIESTFNEFVPDLVINAAAYTNVDQSESEPATADLVNHIGVNNLVQACSSKNSNLIHISTDYVFDGIKPNSDYWYVESDLTNPINQYGISKLKGEQVALEYDKSIVLRTSWVYGSSGHNFVKTMLKLAKTDKELRVVDDQFGCPSSTVDLSFAISSIVDQEMHTKGLFHAASPTSCSWWEFATEAIGLAGIEKSVEAIPTEEYPLPAKRPLDTKMDSTLLFDKYNFRFQPWQKSLVEVVSEIVE